MNDLTSHKDFKNLIAQHPNYAVAFCTSIVARLNGLDTPVIAAEEAEKPPKPKKRARAGRPAAESASD